jgi:hypothetical protein
MKWDENACTAHSDPKKPHANLGPELTIRQNRTRHDDREFRFGAHVP